MKNNVKYTFFSQFIRLDKPLIRFLYIPSVRENCIEVVVAWERDETTKPNQCLDRKIYRSRQTRRQVRIQKPLRCIVKKGSAPSILTIVE